jgi:hypothetical protein
MMNRLLTQQEIAKLLEDKPFAVLPNKIVMEIILNAQSNKTNADWISWGESLPHPGCYGKCDTKNFCNNTSCFWQNWQTRKKKVEL